jgi:hypothetical protein
VGDGEFARELQSGGRLSGTSGAVDGYDQWRPPEVGDLGVRGSEGNGLEEERRFFS